MMRSHGNTQKHESSNPIQRALIDRFHADVGDLVELASPTRILELGCGEGYVLAALEERGIEAAMVGVDFAADAIASARSRVSSDVDLHVGDARGFLTATDEPSPDLVMMLEVLEHLEHPGEMLDELTELGGRQVLLSVPREPWFRGMNLLRLKNVRSLGNDPEHLNHWSSRSFVEFVGRRIEVRAVRRPFPWTLVLGRIASE